MQINILFVDDEPSILNAIKRVFRKSPYKILTADTAERALELIQTTAISVLVSDYTMPGKTGAELLAAARKIRPDMTGVILSGNGDQEATIQSINLGAASRFLTKPWDDNELILEIDKAVAEWEETRYQLPDKKLLNQSAFVETVDALVSSGQLSHHVVVYFGIRDFEKMQTRLGWSQVTNFLRYIAPFPSSQNSCLALGLLDDNHYCGLVSIEDYPGDIESTVLNIVNLLPSSVVYDNQKYRISLDVGYCPVSGENEQASELIDRALTACEHARLAGQTNLVGFQPSMDERKQNLQVMENSLQDALAENEFVLYYQPKINSLDGSMHGAEALIRWNSKYQGMVMPDKFIPLAERNDSIIDIGQWVMGEAAHQWVNWQGIRDLKSTVSVNVSQKQLQDTSFVKRIESVLSETGIDASMFELEITETLMMEDISTTISVLKEIKALGVMLSIDDFGTGYSSLSQLNLLPVDTLKIDRSFILPMMESKVSRDLVRNLIKMGHDLGIDIVAEGVEEVEQLNFLIGYGCDVIQGYYFSPPVPADEYLKLIDKYQIEHTRATEVPPIRAVS